MNGKNKQDEDFQNQKNYCHDWRWIRNNFFLKEKKSLAPRTLIRKFTSIRLSLCELMKSFAFHTQVGSCRQDGKVRGQEAEVKPLS